MKKVIFAIGLMMALNACCGKKCENKANTNACDTTLSTSQDSLKSDTTLTK